eukprot:205680-Hanusia_phi.AAC.1
MLRPAALLHLPRRLHRHKSNSSQKAAQGSSSSGAAGVDSDRSYAAGDSGHSSSAAAGKES